MQWVHLVSRRYWLRKTDRGRFHVLDYLGAARTGSGWEGWRDNLSCAENFRRLGLRPDVIVIYKPQDVRGLRDYKAAFKILCFNEVKPDRAEREILLSGANLCIHHHINDSQTLRRLCRNIAHIPHNYHPGIFFDQQAPRNTDFLLVGILNKKIYPFREKLRKALEILSGEYRCEAHPHPGYDVLGADQNSHLYEFANALNRTKVAVSCSSRYLYRLQKYVEIPACGTVHASDTPLTEPQDGLSATLEVLNPLDPPEAIASRLEALLGDEKRLLEKKLAGLEYVKDYTVAKYAEKLEEATKKALSQKD